MKTTFCLTIRFIQPYPLFHGSRDAGRAEWPPSPMRAFQSLLNAACLRMRGKPLAPDVRKALQLLEGIRPDIVSPQATRCTVGHRAYVPHNHADLITAAWHRGNLEASIASQRVEKDHRPMRIQTVGDELPTVYYLYPLESVEADPQSLLDAISPSVRAIHCLGWGIDQVIADATLIDGGQSSRLIGERYSPTASGGSSLRAPRQGSLDALISRHDRFLNRLTGSDWTPVPPLTMVDQVRYRRACDTLPRPHAIFKLVDDNDDTVSYPQNQLIHIAGMVKHLAIEVMQRNPPRDLRGESPAKWVERYVAGHQSKEDKAANIPHTQFSYIPLQSIGTEHTDPSVRRVMIVAPIGDDAWLDHLAERLDGMSLKPDPQFQNTKLPPGTRLELIGDRQRDGVRDGYLRSSFTWASVTPVILNRYVEKLKQTLPDGRVVDCLDREEIRRQIVLALQQSGIDQPCEFEWSPFSHFRKMLSAHKYRKAADNSQKKFEIGYIRPDHLAGRTALHLVIRFGERENPTDPDSRWIPSDHPIPGPITIGAGRHCGFGLMATVND